MIHFRSHRTAFYRLPGIINRTGESIVLYRNQDGDYDFDYLYAESFGGETVALEPSEIRYDAELNTFLTHPEACLCPVCEEGIKSAPIDNETKVLKFVERSFRKFTPLENHTNSTIVIGMNYGKVSFQSVSTYFHNPEVTVLSCGK